MSVLRFVPIKNLNNTTEIKYFLKIGLRGPFIAKQFFKLAKKGISHVRFRQYQKHFRLFLSYCSSAWPDSLAKKLKLSLQKSRLRGKPGILQVKDTFSFVNVKPEDMSKCHSNIICTSKPRKM